MDLFQRLKQMMIQYRFRPKHKLGQNFMVNEKVFEKMVESVEISKKDVVLEIGGGTGFLSEKILEKNPKKLVIVEKDESLFSVLEQRFGNEKNVELILGDALEIDYEKFKVTKICASPPYYISSDLMFKLLPLNFDKAALLFQHEFVEKLVAEAGFLEYNVLSVITNYFCLPSLLMKVPRKSFYPVPKSESSVVFLQKEYRFDEVEDEEAFVEFVKEVFRYKNKNLKRAMQKLDFESKDEALEELEIGEEKVSKVEVEDFVELFNLL